MLFCVQLQSYIEAVLEVCLSQVTLYCTGSEPGKNTDDHLVKKNNSDAAFGFVSFSVHAVAVY